MGFWGIWAYKPLGTPSAEGADAGASLDNDEDAGEFVDDYDSDEDRLRNLKNCHKLDFGYGSRRSDGGTCSLSLSGSGVSSSSVNSGTSSLRTSLSSIGAGAGGGGGYSCSTSYAVSEAPTLFETDSILAIEAQYK